jgi:ribosomal protein L2
MVAVAECLASMYECLSSMHEALSVNPNSAKKRKVTKKIITIVGKMASKEKSQQNEIDDTRAYYYLWLPKMLYDPF